MTMPVVPESEYLRERQARIRAERAIEAALAELADTRPNMRKRAFDAIRTTWKGTP
jgi:hypothetical protein